MRFRIKYVFSLKYIKLSLERLSNYCLKVVHFHKYLKSFRDARKVSSTAILKLSHNSKQIYCEVIEVYSSHQLQRKEKSVLSVRPMEFFLHLEHVRAISTEARYRKGSAFVKS